MKVGDYVRTEKGVIGKYNIVKTGETIPNWNGGYGYKEIEKEYIDNIIYNRFDDKIIKSSPEIINLVQIGDYVNGCKVVNTNLIPEVPIYRFVIVDTATKNTLYSYDIKSIVTKEQFSSMEYKVN